MSTAAIPFNKPLVTPGSFERLSRALASTHHSGDGPYTRECHAVLESLLGVSKALLTTSCTHALEMTALLLDIGPGDEVIVPSFTFPSTANAYAIRGARLIFADIRPDTLNLDESRLEQLITPRTRAIVVVHYAGIGCAMDEILAIAVRSGVPVIEDNAHGLFGKYKGRWLGTFGTLATQSFHETKNLSCGEGGALLINDAELIERAEILREKGTNRSRFFRGQVDKYTWVDIGSSYLPSDLLAALLASQLAAWQDVQERRRVLWQRYADGLTDWAGDTRTVLPHVPAECESAWHMFQILLPTLDARQRLLGHLKDRGIQAVFHYLPLHLSAYAARWRGKLGDCPVTENVSDRLARLPFYYALTEAEQDRIIDAVRAFEL